MRDSSAFQPRLTRSGEEEFERCLRPARFRDFLGQERLLEPLEVMIRAAMERSETLEHLLFSGLPGLGKTSLALALAAELGTPLKVTSGPALERAKDLVGILSSLDQGTVLFIDEIHRLPKVVEEYLYGAMEGFRIEFTLDQGVHARLLKLDIKPFTLVGATTREALLSSPFRSRFGQVFRFEPYSEESLQRILERSAGILGVPCAPEALAVLAEHSRGTPRVANRLLRRARDVAQVEADGRIEASVVERTFQLLGIDEHGLERADRKVLEALARAEGRPLGLKNLAVATDEEEDTLADVHEPWLIRRGFLARTPQGRVLQEAGWELLGLRPPEAT
ncbi:MAG: Holliday junction branch migration DNA helicase RuvB [Planctomycetes bacterium]|nr:Holliday junction branch migration DNA helicase RuvB [Planctomycetota bacterium]MBL7008539.1 Holliday junction branch migration DNA helicase RuvB [Planctomycetota bacterium]